MMNENSEFYGVEIGIFGKLWLNVIILQKII